MNLIRISKKLSRLLRHCDTPLYISLDGGWANADTITKVLAESNPGFTRETLEKIVADDPKGRYSFDETGELIRANYGHSIPGVVIKMETPEPPEYLYHGTSTRSLDSIFREGIKPMKRQFVHISPDYATAVTVGSRHGKAVVLKIRARDFANDGYTLYRASNGTWLTKHIPPEYFEITNGE